MMGIKRKNRTPDMNPQTVSYQDNESEMLIGKMKLKTKLKKIGRQKYIDQSWDNVNNASLSNALSVENQTRRMNASLGGGSTASIGLPAVQNNTFVRNRFGSVSSLEQNAWIEQTFKKRECIRYIPSLKYSHKCGCGKLEHLHSTSAFKEVKRETISVNKGTDLRKKIPDEFRSDEEPDQEMTGQESDSPLRQPSKPHSEKWSVRKHSVLFPTDAYGTIEFEGGPHPHKAQFLRLDFESNPVDIMNLFEHVWEMPPPKLIISVHGGISNFNLQQKLTRVFRRGLLKVAQTTGAWIITSGINAGVARHVAAAISGASSASRLRTKIVCIGIAPWGLLKKREDLLGHDVVVPYHPHSYSPKGRFTILNNRHSYFLLVDNGTTGRYGADMILRKRLETYITQKQKIGGGIPGVPVVCLVLEGGSRTIRDVLDYVTRSPKVPVVIFDGSGRAADLLAFTCRLFQDEGKFSALKPQLLNLIDDIFACGRPNAEKILCELTKCSEQKHLMTIFRLGEEQKQDVDYAILTALLRGQNLSPPDQLALALAWNRVDIARSDVFILGQEWPKSALDNAMMEALINDRVDFVRLLLEHGVSMKKFLTINRLEELYNTDEGPPNTLYYIVRDVVKIRPGYRYRIPHIGLAIEKLMGNAFKFSYTTGSFLKMYNDRKNENLLSRKYQTVGSNSHTSFPTDSYSIGISNNPDVSTTNEGLTAISGSRALSNHILWRSAFRDNPMHTFGNSSKNFKTAKTAIDVDEDHDVRNEDFKYPFSELLIWAVLTKRQEMALCMWQHGEEAMAKALVACMLYKSLAKEAAEDYLAVEICEELRKYAEQFRKLSLALLDYCYHQDDAQTLQLLTYELTSWGNQTCLSLAVIVNNKEFFAHPCCQTLLADLWHGGLRMRSHSNLKVLLGLLILPSIFFLEFKTREELLLQPQTAAEHEDDIKDSSSSSSSSSRSDSSSESDYSLGEAHAEESTKRKASEGSVQSLNLVGLFHGKRKPKHQNNASQSTPANKVVFSTDGSTGKVDIVLENTNDTLNKSCVIDIDGSRKMSMLNNMNVKRSMSRQTSSRSRKKTTRCRTESSLSAKPPSDLAQADQRTRWPFEVDKDVILPASRKLITVPGQTLPRMRPIKLRRKLYEFFMAPITTFWAWSLSYIVFICLNTYNLLIKTPPQPTVLEWIVFSYVFTLTIEHLRKFLMAEPELLSQKAKFYFSNIWNSITSLGTITFLIGFALRLHPATARTHGRIILAVNSSIWVVRILDIMSVNPRMGPLITMAGKMIQNGVYMVVLISISLLAFGVARQSITYPNEEWDWILLRNVVYKPYFMLYGEVYADEIDTCGDEAWDQHLEEGIPISDLYNGSYTRNCVPGYWIPPVLMTCFLLVANLLLISMLLAVFNNIFSQTDKMSKEIWLFERYRQVMEYESTPFLPPPFTPIYHIWMLIKYVKLRTFYSKLTDEPKRRKNIFDFTLKLFLNDDQVEKIHDFEEECMEDMARNKEYLKNTSVEERIHRISDRSDLMLSRINDLTKKEPQLKANIRDVINRLDVLEHRQLRVDNRLDELVDLLRRNILPAITEGEEKSESSSETGSSGSISEKEAARKFPESLSEQQPKEVKQGTKVDLSKVQSGKREKKVLPVQRTRRTRNYTTTGCDLYSPELPCGYKKFGSLISLDPSMLSTFTNSFPNVAARNRNAFESFRRPRHNNEYTSITDALVFSEDDTSFNEPEIEPRMLHEHTDLESESDDEVVMSFDDETNDVEESGTPNSTLKRAKGSFIRRQNDYLKFYEEQVMDESEGSLADHGESSSSKMFPKAVIVPPSTSNLSPTQEGTELSPTQSSSSNDKNKN